MKIKKQKIIRLKDPIKLELTSRKNDPFGKFCNVYNDGNHFVAVPIKHLDRKVYISSNNKFSIEEKACFDNLYSYFLAQGIVKPNKLFYLIKDAMLATFPYLQDIDDAVKENIERQRSNFFSRIKRLKRKANLNIWNKFVTITYDPKKHTELTFRKKLKKCLSNLHSRRGWNYMGIFEFSPEKERLHFHAIMYIPKNEMIGTIEEKKDWSTAKHEMQITHSNSFFAETFGRNDFEELTDADMKSGRTLEYLTKYISKSNEKIVYSRGIPTELQLYIENEDLFVEYIDYVQKYVLLDDCINKQTGYTAYSPPKYYSNLFEYGLSFT